MAISVEQHNGAENAQLNLEKHPYWKHWNLSENCKNQGGNFDVVIQMFQQYL